ncbi:MAG: hypothetical protein E6Q97_06655 [Desulfurellales bacterium]|nr:MAG: hypothetical protein E6Q97_06655 [Desulfurellales bacterium]
MRKNVSGQAISANLLSKTDGSAVTTGTTTVYVTGDAGTQVSGGGTVTHKGNGEWSYAPTQAETNYTHIAFTFVNANAVGQTLNVYTVGQDFTGATLASTVTTNNDKTGYSLTAPYDAAKTAAQAGDEMALTESALLDVRNKFLIANDSLNAPAVTANSVELSSGYAADDSLVGCHLFHFTDVGVFIQARTITAWDNSTLVATVDRAWDVTPADTDRVLIFAGPLDSTKTGYALTSAYDPAKTAAQAGDAMTLANDAVSAAVLAADAIAEIKAAVEETLSSTSRAELAAVPSANASLSDKLTWIATVLRNKRVVTATEETLYADDGTTPIATSDVTAASGTLTRGEYTDVP